MTTPNFGMPELVEGQAGGEVLYNESLAVLDFFAQGVLVDRDISTPPGSPANGDAYLVAGTGTGAWAGHDGKIALYVDGWLFYTPKEGWRLWVSDEDVFIVYTGAAWRGAGGLYTASRAMVTDANGVAGVSSVTAAELGYVAGVTSAIQTQLDGKAASSHNHAASDITSGTLPIARGGTNSATALNNNRVMVSSSGAIAEAAAITASRALVSDSNGMPEASATTATELGYVYGVTSAIQTQLNTKLAASQAASVAALADSTGGTADGTLAAIGATDVSDVSADINNNFADIGAKVAAILTSLKNAGIMAT